MEFCPWRDANGNVDVRLFARDHFLGAGASDNITYDPVAAASSFTAGAGAIAHGEEFTYTVGVGLPAPGRTLTVTMVRETVTQNAVENTKHWLIKVATTQLFLR